MSYFTRSSSVKELQGRNFSQGGITVQGPVVCMVYANWCPHCKTLAGVWDQIGQKFPNKVGAVDCAVHKEVSGLLGVKGFPTIVSFKNGKLSEIYSGNRDLNSLTKWCYSQLK
jgi:thioredoxin-like negative regulator of GroEL